MEMVLGLIGPQMDVMYVFLNNVGMELYFISALLGVIGLVIGSFVSVVTYRIPRNLGFVKGRSFCDNCKKDLNWYDNMPILSFFFYRGKSKCCKEKISPRYPLIEIASASGAYFLFFNFSNFFSNYNTMQWHALILFYMLYIVSLAIVVIDIEHQIIPDEMIWILLLLGLLLNHGSLITAFFSSFLFSLLLLFLYLVTLGRGMVLGDVKLAIPLGFILGIEKGFYWIISSFILGGITATILLILKRANLKTKIAFGPFLIIGFWLVIFTNRLF